MNVSLAPVPANQCLIAVSPDDQAIAPMQKALCHSGDGVLHRAFSVFLFDDHGRVLLQQRSALKPLWPGYWANSCCSHPRWGETLDRAVVRRVNEELGIMLTQPPHWRFHFIYHARYDDIGSEHELCHVCTAHVDGQLPKPDPDEVAAWKWVSPGCLEQALQDVDAPLTPWLRLEWPQLFPLLHTAAPAIALSSAE